MTPILSRLALILTGATAAQLWQAAPVAAQTSLLEVDKGEVKLMQVNDDGGLVALGTEGQGVIPARGTGARLMWYPGKAAFRAGVAVSTTWDEGNVGRASLAGGAHTTASGEASTALGVATVASGRAATAMGDITKATGNRATAMGLSTTASGEASTAMGINTLASGSHATALGAGSRATGNETTAIGTETLASGARSMAMGFRTTAAGDRSTAMGSDAGTLPGASGTFVYGDASTETDLVSLTPNEFVVRAAGGFRLRTNASLSTGCDLPAGSGTFNCTSSRLAKEGFEDLDGEVVLGKLASMPIQRWRYLGTHAPHVGPTAEDFHAAFMLGQGPTTISTVDADGISLRAIQALERRTTELREENAELRGENADLRAKLAEDTAALRTELEALRRIVETGRVAQ